MQPPGLGDDMMNMPDDPQTFQGPPGSVTGSNNPRYDAADTMQGLEIGSQQGSNYGAPLDPNLPDLGPNMDLSFQGEMQAQHNNQAPPSQQSNQPDQMAAWFDTDL